MSITALRTVTSYSGTDDKELYVVRKDISGGVNTRQHEQSIEENQVTVLTNGLLDVFGQRGLRSGLTLVQDLGSNAGTGIFGFEPDGGTNELLVTEGTNLQGWTGSTFTNHKADFTTGLETTMIKAGESGENDVVIISNGTDNVFRMLQAHTFQDLGDTNTSPPKTKVYLYYRNRLWALKSNLLSFSDAFPADYSTAFNRTTNVFRVPVGTERFLIGLREMGIVIGGVDAIWGLNPSLTPVATDKPEKIIDIGCVAGKTACQVGDDVLFLAPDGVRGVFRTQQDKLQLGASFPLSYSLKSEFEGINWAQISKASAVYWDNKYFLTLAAGVSTYNNQVWIYYPAFKSWSIVSGWNVSYFTKLKISGEERLYAVDANDGSVYRCWSGTSDNGTAITYTEEGRAEDFKYPLQYKVGGEVKIKVRGGSGDITVSINLDGSGYQQLGTLSLTITGVTYPTTFPVTFNNTNEQIANWHYDNLGKFKRAKVKIYSTSLNASITVLESIITAFLEEYFSED